MSPASNIEGLYFLESDEFSDHRGSLSRVFQSSGLTDLDFNTTWRQAFISRTTKKNTVRGLHYQYGDGEEAKLIIPLSGEMFWIAVDLRRESATFGAWQSAILSEGRGQALLVAPRFAHGCMSLSDSVEIFILSNADPAPDYGGGIKWNDPDLKIKWPVLEGEPIISEAHANFPDFAQFLRTRGKL